MNNAVKALLNASLFSAIDMAASQYVKPGKVNHTCPACGKEFESFNRFVCRCDDCRAKDQPEKAEKFKHWTKRKK